MCEACGLMALSSEDELVLLPLGGAGEIGMNFNAYGFGPPHERKWIVVDFASSRAGENFGDCFSCFW